MKKLFFVLLMTNALCTYAQLDTARVYAVGNVFYDDLVKVYEVENGYALFGTSASDSLNSGKIVVILTDSNFNVLESSTFGVSQVNSAIAASQLSTELFVIAAYARDSQSPQLTWQLIGVRIKNGNIALLKDLRFNEVVVNLNIQMGIDSSIFAVNYIEKSSNVIGQATAKQIELDTNFNVLNRTSDSTWHIIQWSQNVDYQFILKSNLTKQSNFELEKTGIQGNKFQIDSAFNFVPSGFISDSNKVMLYGKTTDVSGFSHYAILVLDHDLNQIARRDYTVVNSNDNVVDIKPFGSDYYILGAYGGNGLFGAGLTDFQLFKINKSLDFVDGTTYGFGANDYPKGLILKPNGNLLLYGTTISNDDVMENMLIVKSDTGLPTFPFPLEPIVRRVLPPSNYYPTQAGVVNVGEHKVWMRQNSLYFSGFIDEATYALYNLNGQILDLGILRGQEIHFSQPSGLYIIAIQENEKIFRFKVFTQ